MTQNKSVCTKSLHVEWSVTASSCTTHKQVLLPPLSQTWICRDSRNYISTADQFKRSEISKLRILLFRRQTGLLPEVKTPTELVIYWDLSAASILWLLGQVWISMSWLSFTAGGYDNSVYKPQWLRQLLYNRITQLPTEIMLTDIKWPWVTRLSWLSPFLEAQLPHRTLNQS